MRTSNNEGRRGSIAVTAALSLVVLVGFGAFAIDYGYLHFKRSQLQTAADTAALAGAAVLLSSGENLEQIQDVAVDIGRKNLTADDDPTGALTLGDVTFYKGGVPAAVSPDAVEVTVNRTTGAGNPVDLFLGPVLGRQDADVSATARASLFCSAGTNCLKPLSPPAKFTWDDSCDGNKKYKNNGQLDYDSACELSSVEVQGYGEADLGTSIVLKMGDSSDTNVPGHYNPVDFPPSNKGAPVSGADEYRENLTNSCAGSNNTSVEAGDSLQIEPGKMTGPTKQGISDLIAEDPSAYWDADTNSIQGSDFSDPMAGPRVALIPFHDPSVYQPSGRNDVVVHQLGAVFIESITGKGDVNGRFIKAMAVNPVRDDDACDTAEYGLYGVSLSRDSSRQ